LATVWAIFSSQTRLVTLKPDQAEKMALWHFGDGFFRGKIKVLLGFSKKWFTVRRHTHSSREASCECRYGFAYFGLFL
jgi:hypothetical protein